MSGFKNRHYLDPSHDVLVWDGKPEEGESTAVDDNRNGWETEKKEEKAFETDPP